MSLPCPIENIRDLTSTAAELNKLDGVTATAAELNKVAGLGATTAEIDAVADVSAYSKKYTVTAPAAIPSTVRVIELDHATTAIEKTVASLVPYAGQIVVVKNTSASGTAAHKVTVTTGTWNGTNKVATLNAPGETLVVFIDSTGNGVVLLNVGEVALA